MAPNSRTKLQIISLRAQGYSYNKIAEEVKVSKQTVIDVARAERKEIDTLLSTDMEAPFEAHQINLKGRLDQLSTLQRRLLEEIKNRDLSDLPTKDLINLYLSTSKSIKEEVFAPEILPSSEQESAATKRAMWNF